MIKDVLVVHNNSEAKEDPNGNICVGKDDFFDNPIRDSHFCETLTLIFDES